VLIPLQLAGSVARYLPHHVARNALHQEHFLVRFEDARRDNRAAADEGRDPKKLDRELLTYDQL
jgi:hypothetical protein